VVCVRALVNVFWANQGKIGSVRAPRIRLLTHDMRQTLLCFAQRQSFSSVSRGGGNESNLLLLPFWVQMGEHLLSVDTTQRPVYETALREHLGGANALLGALRAPRDGLTARVAAGVATSLPSLSALATQTEDAAYALALSLLLLPRRIWLRCRLALLSRALVERVLSAAAAAARSGGSSSSATSSGFGLAGAPSLSPAASLSASGGQAGAAGEDAGAPATSAADADAMAVDQPVSGGGEAPSEPRQRFVVVKQTLILFGIVDKLHALLKHEADDSDQQAPSGAASSSNSNDDATSLPAQSNNAAWLTRMLARIQPGDALRNKCRALLSTIEDQLYAFDEAQEFLDELGLLADVMREFGSASNFVEAAFAVAAAYRDASRTSSSSSSSTAAVASNK
jgi:hypothetical protein